MLQRFDAGRVVSEFLFLRISQWGPGLGLGNVQEFHFQRLEGQMTNLEWEGRQPGVTAVTAPTLG